MRGLLGGGGGGEWKVGVEDWVWTRGTLRVSNPATSGLDAFACAVDHAACEGASRCDAGLDAA